MASTRPMRVGQVVGEWLTSEATVHDQFDVEVVDLAAVRLPLFDEPQHPRSQHYAHQHTKDWSATIARADAFVIVTPEYNHSFPAALKNALDFLNVEWAYKPVAIASYGGVSGGLRAATALKPVLSALRMIIALEAVAIPFASVKFSAGPPSDDESLNKAAARMLDELVRLHGASRSLRTATTMR